MLRLTLTLTSLMLAATSFAEVEGLTTLDINKDGSISIQEATAVPELLAAFSSIDLDENGLISRDELMQSDFKDTLPTLFVQHTEEPQSEHQ